MERRRWTQKEIDYLKDRSPHMLVRSMAKKLGRSKNAVNQKMQRCGIESYYHATDLLCVNHIVKLMGVTREGVHAWMRNGLPSKKIGKRLLIDADDLTNYLKEHPSEWKLGKVRDREIFDALTGFEFKDIQAEIPKPYLWTPMETATLIHMYVKGATKREISAATGRPMAGVKQRIKLLRAKGILPPREAIKKGGSNEPPGTQKVSQTAGSES